MKATDAPTFLKQAPYFTNPSIFMEKIWTTPSSPTYNPFIKAGSNYEKAINYFWKSFITDMCQGFKYGSKLKWFKVKLETLKDFIILDEMIGLIYLYHIHQNKMGSLKCLKILRLCL